MKKIIVLLLGLVALSAVNGQSNFEKAMRTAKEKHLLILLNFSGSDWCIPCIQMRTDIFENRVFSAMADSALVLLIADFPRLKKNQPPNDIKKENEALADKYDPEGKFPFTLLLTADGKVIHTWDGIPKKDAAQFAKEIKNICDAGK